MAMGMAGRAAGGRWRVIVALALALALVATALGVPAPVGATTAAARAG